MECRGSEDLAVYGVTRGSLSSRARQGRLRGATLAQLALSAVLHQGGAKAEGRERGAGRLRERLLQAWVAYEVEEPDILFCSGPESPRRGRGTGERWPRKPEGSKLLPGVLSPLRDVPETSAGEGEGWHGRKEAGGKGQMREQSGKVWKAGKYLLLPQRSAQLTTWSIQVLLKSSLLRQTFPETHGGWGGKAR